MTNDNLLKLNNFFEKYIDKRLIKDLELLIERNEDLKFSYPYILLASSGIDLFGGIEKGFVNPDGWRNSKERFVWFITTWMGKINSLYKEESLSRLIYDSWRCGVVHQATLKKGFETSSHIFPREKHLYYDVGNANIFIHSMQFAEDLIEAQRLYRKYINDNESNLNYINLLYTNLLSMMNENDSENKQNINQFVKLLQQKQLIFNFPDNISIANLNANTVTTTSEKSTSCEPPPSAMPKENDL